MSKSKAQKRRAHQPHGQKSKETTAAPHRERGALLTAVIIIIILHGALFALLAWSDLNTNGRQVKSLYMPLLMLTSAADIIAGIALWYWKKWGFQLYVAATLVMATAALMNTGSMLILFASILPTIVVAYIFLPKQNMFD